MRLINLFLTTISIFLFNVSNSFVFPDSSRFLQTRNKTISNKTQSIPNINPFVLQTKNTKVEDFDLFFISYGLFGAFVVSSLIAKKIFNIAYFVKRIPYLNISRESFIFGGIYTSWWLILLSYSFYTDKYNEILFRLGIWITINMGSVLIPVTRNSIWLILFNISYDQILHLHKYMAILCLISVLIKFIVVIIYSGFPFLIIPINYTTGGSPLMGTISTLSILLSGLLSFPYIRNKCFELFYYSHKILAVIAILSGSLHYLTTLYYMLPSILMFSIDLFCRYLHTHKAIYSHLKIVGDDEHNTSCVFIHITLLKPIKVNYGSYFFICFKDISKFQSHPLSLISETNENLIFCAKDRGKNTWTNKLKKYNSSSVEDILMNKDITIQGPYGHITIPYDKNVYKYILSIAGGIGITSVISVLQDINQLYNNNKLSNITKISLIWIVNHYSIVKPFKSLLLNLNKDVFDITIYITKDSDDENPNVNFNIINSRPVISKLIKDFIIKNKILTKDMAVMCCGPRNLSLDVLTTCSELNIDISNENF